MSWNPNIPNANDQISQSQDQIKQNFQALDVLFDGGIQDFVILPQQVTAPTTGAGEVSLYSKLVTGVPQLFMRQQSNGTEFNFTSSTQTSNGYTYLPSGILLRWGRVGVTTTVQPYVLPVGSIPAFTQIFQVQLTPMDTSTNNFTLGLRSINGTTGFTVYSANPTISTVMQYLIIGI